MKNIKKAASILFGLSICLTGCGIQDEEANNKELNNAKPLGYYSNEHHEDTNGGNARVLDGEDNDGPLTEMMDHTFGEEGQQRDQVVRNVNNDRSKNQDNNRINQDINYDIDLSQKIDAAAAKVENVQDVNTFVYGDQVLIALQVNNRKNMDRTERRTKEEINPYINNKNVSIVTDQGIFSGIEEINKKIREGQPEKTISTNIEDMLEKVETDVNK
ncbi:YhcN/YlaJ family sporulation lipoprotein [Niallia sp. 01092]|uniref:YhcN/YlaJ family sporulation lipoprotein n=1 Tax=unclassified Niallia TaxID=2837522 RepID=UPI003FCFD17F